MVPFGEKKVDRFASVKTLGVLTVLSLSWIEGMELLFNNVLFSNMAIFILMVCRPVQIPLTRVTNDFRPILRLATAPQ